MATAVMTERLYGIFCIWTVKDVDELKVEAR